MADDCKILEKEAKNLEKTDPDGSVEGYKKAAKCYNGIDKEKNANACLEKAAKILRDKAKDTENPEDALKIYNKSIELYKQAGKDSEESKVMGEANKKFIENAKSLKAEAKKMEDIDAAEKKLSLASDYAKKGGDEDLGKECWVDSGDHYRDKAAEIDNPREALEVYKHAIQNYKKGNDDETVSKTLKEAAQKFSKKGKDIEKSKKDLVLAIDNYIQAALVFEAANDEDEASALDGQIQELCEFIGIDLDSIKNFLEKKGFSSVSI